VLQAWALCSGKGVQGHQMCLGEIRVWTCFWLHPAVEIWVGRAVAPPRVTFLVEIWLDALWLQPG